MVATSQVLNDPHRAARLYEEIEREISQRGLSGYARCMWRVLEPRTRPLIGGWALDAICEHLEAVTHGHLNRLLITVPPGMTKSMSTRVFWPTWEWGPLNMPQLRTVGASYHGNLALRDNRRAKLLMESRKFRSYWPHVKRTDDQWGNLRLSNSEHGFMLATSVHGMGTGERGDRFVIDDPHNVRQGESKAVMQSTVNWFHEVVPTRLNDQSESAIIIIMQRVAVGDVADQAIELGYEHLMLPMEFERDRRCTTSIGFTDPRDEEGELLAPDRFTRGDVDELKRTLGSYGTASQLQQRPAPREGNIIKVDLMRPAARPNERMVKKRVRYFDKGGGDASESDYTSGARVALVDHPDGEYYLVEHVWRDQLSAGPRERRIRQTAETDPEGTRFVVEQEPGSGGKESAESTVRNLRGFSVRVDRKSIDKVSHADPFATAVENGLVWYLLGEWNNDWIDELRNFPASIHDDQVDATAGAFNYLHHRSRAGVLF